MKTGKTISELAGEVQRQAETRRDLVTRTTALHFADDGGRLSMELMGHGRYPVNDLAHSQISDYAGIPGACHIQGGLDAWKKACGPIARPRAAAW